MNQQQIECVAEALSDYLTQLGVDPDEHPDHDSDTTAMVLARVAIRAMEKVASTHKPDPLAQYQVGERKMTKPLQDIVDTQLVPGYGCQEALDHYPDPPPKPRPTLADYPNGLVGTLWRYMGEEQVGKVIKHDGIHVEVGYPTCTVGIDVQWLFDAYEPAEAPEATGEDRVRQCMACGAKTTHMACEDYFCGGPTKAI